MLLTDQVTEVLEVPEMVAEKEAESPMRTFAEEGETAMVMAGARGGCWVPAEEEVEPQPAKAHERKNGAIKRTENGVRIGSPIFGGEEKEDNWTEGQKRGKDSKNGIWGTHFNKREKQIPRVARDENEGIGEARCWCLIVGLTGVGL